MNKYLYILMIFVFISLTLPFYILANNNMTQGLIGYDLSYPQCYASVPSIPYDFTILGINGGKAFTQNPCLLQELIWAKTTKQKIEVYSNLNYPSGKTISFGNMGQAGLCHRYDYVCQSYNYGYYAGKFSYEYASSQVVNSNIWWIDIETANTWSDNYKLNRMVLEGMVDFFTSKYIHIGIYSTTYEWTQIMGNDFIPRQSVIAVIPLPLHGMAIPNWVGGGDQNTLSDFCHKPFIPMSKVWFVQYVPNEYDNDYSCS